MTNSIKRLAPFLLMGLVVFVISACSNGNEGDQSADEASVWEQKDMVK